MKQKYAFQGSQKNKARAMGKSLSISTKQSIEICKFIKGMPVEKARNALENAIDLKNPIKFTRFVNGAGHKPGMGSGKYPVKTAIEILKILNSAEANAQNMGLGADLIVHHACAHQAARSFKYGRQSRRKEKSTHVEILVREVEGGKKKKAAETKKEDSQKTVKSETPKKESTQKAEDKKPVKAEKKETKPESKKEDKKEAPKKEAKPAEKKSESTKSKESESKEDNK